MSRKSLLVPKSGLPKIGECVTFHSAFGDIQAKVVNIAERRVRIVITRPPSVPETLK